MDQQPVPNARQPWQFSLGSLLIAVVFVALACATTKLLIRVLHLDSPPDPWHHPWHHVLSPLDVLIGYLSLMAIPILLCGAIGVLCGRVISWIVFGVGIGVALMLFAPVWDVMAAVVYIAVACAVIKNIVQLVDPKGPAKSAEPIGPWRSAKRGAVYGATGIGSLIPVAIVILGIISLHGHANRMEDVMVQGMTPPSSFWVFECGLTAFGALVGSGFGAAIGWDRRRLWQRTMTAGQKPNS